jgi:integrase
MAGQIIKRGDKTWLVRIFIGREAQGKRRYLNKTVRGNKKDAETYLSNTLTAMSSGTFVEASPITVSEYLERWLQTAASKRVRERTFTDYSELLNRYVYPAIGDERLSSVRPLHIQALYSHMTAPKLKKDDEPKAGMTYGLGLSARTVRYTHAVLSAALKQAVKWLILAQNPAAHVDLPRATPKEMQALSPDEAARFLIEARKDRWCALFSLALTTGMRPEEYLALQWKDIDFEKGIATVQRALVWLRKKGAGWIFSAPKTARSRRSIPLPPSVLRALQAHRRLQAEERLKAGAEYQNHDLVFASREGTPIMIRNLLRRHFKPILKRAKLPKTIRLYDLRHSCATLLLAANEHPKVVSERLGHASVTLTLDTYSHVLPSMQQAATDKLESILFEKKTRSKKVG